MWARMRHIGSGVALLLILLAFAGVAMIAGVWAFTFEAGAAEGIRKGWRPDEWEHVE